MLVQFAYLNPNLAIPVAVGILTLFGRKKKEEKNSEKKTDKPSAGTIPTSREPVSPKPAEVKAEPKISAQNLQPMDSEDSLSRLLESLMKELPPTSDSDNDQNSKMQSTSEWVPPRSTPPSRPMVIVSGEDGKKILERFEPADTFGVKKVNQPEQPQPPMKSTPAPEQVRSKVEQTEEEPKKISKREVSEKPRLESPRGQGSGPAKGIDHLFETTQGALLNPGVVIVTGPPGAGKTTLCESAAGSYLKRGSPCLFVAYEKAPASLREELQKLGTDVSQHESQFRLLIIDAFSTQSETFSFEPYNIEKPFEIENLKETLLRNREAFLGERVAVILDSLNPLASHASGKEFVKSFQELASKLRESGSVLVVSVDLDKFPKEVTRSLEDMADCIVSLERDGANGRRLIVRSVNGSDSKSTAEPFEIDSTKGLLFV